MSRYVVAIKRRVRRNAAADWFKPALNIAELRVLSPTRGSSRVYVEGDDETISQLRTLLSPLCHIEEVVEHRPHIVVR